MKSGFKKFKKDIFKAQKKLTKKTKPLKRKLKTLVLSKEGAVTSSSLSSDKRDSQSSYKAQSDGSTVPQNDSDDGIWSSDSFDVPKSHKPFRKQVEPAAKFPLRQSRFLVI